MVLGGIVEEVLVALGVDEHTALAARARLNLGQVCKQRRACPLDVGESRGGNRLGCGSSGGGRSSGRSSGRLLDCGGGRLCADWGRLLNDDDRRRLDRGLLGCGGLLCGFFYC